MGQYSPKVLGGIQFVLRECLWVTVFIPALNQEFGVFRICFASSARLLLTVVIE